MELGFERAVKQMFAIVLLNSSSKAQKRVIMLAVLRLGKENGRLF